MKILAYADRLSAAPGERIGFKVSCDGLDRFEAALIRVIQGDTNPQGPGYRAQEIALDLGGPFAGRFQPIRTGSYAVVDDSYVFDGLASFSVLAAVYPTTPGAGEQTLLSRRNAGDGRGFELFLNADGGLSFELTARSGQSVRASSGEPLLASRWYAVCGSYDALSGTLSVFQRPLPRQAGIVSSTSVSAERRTALSQAGVGAPLTIAARLTAGAHAQRCFNGRIEAPRLLARPVAGAELAALLDAAADSPFELQFVAAWDFSIGIPTDTVRDVSPHRLHARLVNLPTRGVTGRRWDGRSHDWRQRPEHYAAIHFHDDDLYDAGWQDDFAVRIPDGLHSGVYAVRLSAEDGNEEYFVPFCVRPRRGAARERVAFLLPTASYTAYANNRIGLDVSETELVCGRLIELHPHDLYMQEHPELGLCFYDLHNDGSGVYYSSRLRPIVDMQPKFVGKLGGLGSNVWQFNADTHILGWLEHIGQPFDVITDEDLHTEGLSLIESYQALITGSHPEYYSASMLDALQAYTECGGRLMYLGGNGFYWRIAYHPELPGVIECRKSEDGIRAFAPGPGEFYASFTGEYTGLWRRNGRAPNRLVGVGMVAQGFDISSPYRRTAASFDPRAAFIFDGVDDEVIGAFGLSGGAAAGIELDAADPALGTPPHALVLASSEIHTDLYLMTPEDMLDPVPGLGGTEAQTIRADMVFFETSNGGAVFSTGSIAWAGSMAWRAYDNHVARITHNVLRRFLDAKPITRKCTEGG